MIADIDPLWKSLEDSAIGAAVRQSLWLFPAIETIHLLAMAVLVTTIAAFDLRLVGLALRPIHVQKLAQRLFPWAWAAFAVQVVTGAMLFSSEATKMVINPAFRLIASRHMPTWDAATPTPIAAKLAGVVSLALWIGVVAAGRWIGFI